MPATAFLFAHNGFSLQEDMWLNSSENSLDLFLGVFIP